MLFNLLMYCIVGIQIVFYPNRTVIPQFLLTLLTSFILFDFHIEWWPL